MSPLAGRVLHSRESHARIVGIDARRAKALPGVVAVVIADDVLDTELYHGLYVEDRPLLAVDRVRYAGEPVAAVAAEDAETAERALTLIDVAYEALPAVTTIEAALNGAPRLHVTELLRPGLLHGSTTWRGEPGNVCWRQTTTAGDVAAGVAGSDVIVEGEYRITGDGPATVAASPIVADWTGDGLTLWTTVEAPFLLQATLAKLFELPMDQTRVRGLDDYESNVVSDHSLAPIAAALARKAKRPVRLETATTHPSAGEARLWMRTAATAAGRLVVREVRVEVEVGAFAGDRPLGIDPAPLLGPYRWQATVFEAQGVYTNSPPRAATSPLLAAVGELQVDEIARRLGCDAGELRARNLPDGITSPSLPAPVPLS